MKDKTQKKQCTMSSSKKIDKQIYFAAGVYLSETQNPIHPTLHIVYAYTVYLFTQRRGELNQRNGYRGNRGEYRSHSWVETTNMTECPQEI